MTAPDNARHAETASIDGTVGIVVAPEGARALVWRFVVRDDAIAAIGIVGDPDALQTLDLAMLG
jgi:RNA polymerase sigma-70 factor (ECF subfamily)